MYWAAGLSPWSHVSTSDAPAPQFWRHAPSPLRVAPAACDTVGVWANDLHRVCSRQQPAHGGNLAPSGPLDLRIVRST